MHSSELTFGEILLPMLQPWTLFTIVVASTQHLQSPMSELAHPYNKNFSYSFFQRLLALWKAKYLLLLSFWSLPSLFCILSALLILLSSDWNCKKSWCWCHRMISCCIYSNPGCKNSSKLRPSVLIASAGVLWYRPLQTGELLFKAETPPRELARLVELALVLLLFPILLMITEALTSKCLNHALQCFNVSTFPQVFFPASKSSWLCPCWFWAPWACHWGRSHSGSGGSFCQPSVFFSFPFFFSLSSFLCPCFLPSVSSFVHPSYLFWFLFSLAGWAQFHLGRCLPERRLQRGSLQALEQYWFNPGKIFKQGQTVQRSEVIDK